MRGRAVLVNAVATVSVVALSVAALTGTASATGPVPTATSLPSVTVPTVVTPTVPSPPSVLVRTPEVPSAPRTGGSTPAAGTGSGTANTPPAAGESPKASPTARTPAKKAKEAKEAAKAPVNSVIAGQSGAADVVDHEATPALYQATKVFLKADQQIAGLAKLRDQLRAAKAGAATAAERYRALQVDIDKLRAQAETRQQRSDVLRRMIVSDVRTSYQTSRPARSDQESRDLGAAAARAGDALSRTERLIGAAVIRQNKVRAELDTSAATYDQVKDELTRINQDLEALARQREAALTAARQATGPDQARHRQTLEESGALGEQIRAASARLAATGRTVNGTGSFADPSSGAVTSDYGRRFHPILHHVKLHTGTDLGVGDGHAHAADDGRVLFTVLSTAYGNFTVIDHGVIDGRHITTAYAHQATFLVKPGQAVQRGQTIGVIGQTGYATGPHLHFEVRDHGAVENPMTWLGR